MNTQIPLLVFSDLDGTLLSHETYDWRAARPALDRLRSIGAGLVLASSKTTPEINILREEIGAQEWPAIVENGAGLLEANSAATPDRRSYDLLRAELNKVPPRLRSKFVGFGDLDVTGVAAATGLPPQAAAHAAQRAFSEPGTWSGTQSEREDFQAHLTKQGISAREGGRFLTLSFGKTKADQMAQIIARFAPRHTVALGDAPNDVEMLQAADFGIIVANPHRDPLPFLDGEEAGNIFRTTLEGPEGWNEAMLALLARLKLE